MTHCVCTIYLHFLDRSLENYRLKYICLSTGSALSVPLVTRGVLGEGGGGVVNQDKEELFHWYFQTLLPPQNIPVWSDRVKCLDKTKISSNR